MAPAFDLGGGGLTLALVQGLMIACLFSGFGALLFLGAIVPPALAVANAQTRLAVTRRCAWLARLSLALAVPIGCAWMARETAVMAEANSARQMLGAVPIVLSATLFGHVLLAQVLAAIVALGLTWIGRGGWVWVATACAGSATVLQAWHLHAVAMDGGASLLLVSEVLHVLAAASWLGMLLPLLLFVRAAPVDAAAIAVRRFSPFGAGCVLVLAITAFWQGVVLVGSLHGLLKSAYGWMVLVKLALFVVLIGLAWRNRFRLTPMLHGADMRAGQVALQRSILLEAIAGLLIVLAAAVLASLPPGMHMT